MLMWGQKLSGCNILIKPLKNKEDLKIMSKVKDKMLKAILNSFKGGQLI